MAEGLKLVLSADVKEAEQALKSFTTDLSKLESRVKSFGGGVKTFTTNFNKDFSTLPPAIKKTEVALTKLPKASNAATASLINLGRVAQDAPFGIIGIANNINPLLESFQRLKAESGSTGTALKSLAASLIGGGGLGLAVSVVTGLMSYFALANRGAKDDVEGTSKKVDEAAEKQKAFRAAIDGAAKSVVSEAKEIQNLRDILLSTDAATQQLTQSTINQAVARFVFDEKNVAVQKALAAQVEKQLIARKKLVGTGGLESFTNDKQLNNLIKTEETLKKIGGVSFAPVTADRKRVEELNKTIGAAGGEINTLNALGADLTKFFKGFLDGTKKGKDGTEEFINKAKQLNAELEKVGFIAPVEFSFFDTAAQELEKAKKVFADFNSRNLKIDPKVFTFEAGITEPPPEKVTQMLTETEKLLKRGVLQIPPVEIPLEFSPQEERNASIISDFRKQFEAIGAVMKLPEGALTDPSLFGALKQQLDQVTAATKAADAAANILSNTFGVLINRISQGENPIKAFFQAIGQSILQLITQLITAAIRAAIFKAILAGATGGTSSVFGKLFGKVLGIPGFAAGGIVSGPTLALVGEGVGTSRSNPEVIAPLDQLKSMLGSFGGGEPQIIVVNGRTRGNTFELLANRTQRQNRRLGAG